LKPATHRLDACLQKPAEMVVNLDAFHQISQEDLLLVIVGRINKISFAINVFG
jgi:hypothetical protein